MKRSSRKALKTSIIIIAVIAILTSTAYFLTQGSGLVGSTYAEQGTLRQGSLGVAETLNGVLVSPSLTVTSNGFRVSQVTRGSSVAVDINIKTQPYPCGVPAGGNLNEQIGVSLINSKGEETFLTNGMELNNYFPGACSQAYARNVKKQFTLNDPGMFELRVYYIPNNVDTIQSWTRHSGTIIYKGVETLNTPEAPNALIYYQSLDVKPEPCQWDSTKYAQVFQAFTSKTVYSKDSMKFPVDQTCWAKPVETVSTMGGFGRTFDDFDKTKTFINGESITVGIGQLDYVWYLTELTSDMRNQLGLTVALKDNQGIIVKASGEVEIGDINLLFTPCSGGLTADGTCVTLTQDYCVGKGAGYSYDPAVSKTTCIVDSCVRDYGDEYDLSPYGACGIRIGYEKLCTTPFAYKYDFNDCRWVMSSGSTTSEADKDADGNIIGGLEGTEFASNYATCTGTIAEVVEQDGSFTNYCVTPPSYDCGRDDQVFSIDNKDAPYCIFAKTVLGQTITIKPKCEANELWDTVNEKCVQQQSTYLTIGGNLSTVYLSKTRTPTWAWWLIGAFISSLILIIWLSLRKR